MERRIDRKRWRKPRASNFQSGKLFLSYQATARSPVVQFFLSPVGKTLLCLLSPICLLSWYYHTYFQWTHRFSPPTEGLTYARHCTEPQLNAFCHKSVSSICGPIQNCIDRIIKLRKQTRKGTYRPPGFEEDLHDIRARLNEIMTEARLRRVPMEFEKKYELTLLALQDCFRAVNDLDDSIHQETRSEREKFYKNSIGATSRAQKRCREARSYFTSNAWLEDFKKRRVTTQPGSL